MSSKNVKKTARDSSRLFSMENRELPLYFAVACIVLVVVVIAGYFLYDRCTGGDGADGPKTWQEELLVKLRENRIAWTTEMVADWEEKKTYPPAYTVPYAIYEVPRFESEVAVLNVGEETLYTDDFNRYLFIYHFPEFSSGEKLADSLLLDVADALVEESVLLQEASKLGVVELDESMYSAMGKDYEARGAAIMHAEDELKGSEVSLIRGEKINVWFYNTEPPVIGIEAAREYAEDLITDLQERIVAGELTFEEAGDEIRRDETMHEIDFGLEGNAYGEFEIIGNAEPFHDPEVQEAIEDLEAGEISEILVGRDREDDGWYDAYFVVAVVNEKQGGSATFEGWLSGKADEYMGN